MTRRRWWWLASAALVAASGCAHSEEEWQAQLRTIGELKTKLDAAQAQAQKTRADLDESTAHVEQLRQQLRAAGVDLANLDANLELQARATEEHRRRAEQMDAQRRRIELLRAGLGPLDKEGLAVTVRHNRITLELPGDALFDAGRETLKREGRAMLVKVAAVIRGDPALAGRQYQIVGHVDAAPRGVPFKDAVGLSAMRAREVLALLVQPVDKGGGGLDPGRWSAAGYGEVDPLRSNDTAEGRQANRRCEIILQPAAEEELDLRSQAPAPRPPSRSAP
jgi:chemotaxis protein MotB